jgi:thiamine kinase-like enzyme
VWFFARDWLVKILEHSDSSQEGAFGLNIWDDETIDPRKLDDEINYLQRRLDKRDTQIGFCHNDLQYGNIMLSEKDDSVTLTKEFCCLPLPHCYTSPS